jgi:hypothetical protein
MHETSNYSSLSNGRCNVSEGVIFLQFATCRIQQHSRFCRQGKQHFSCHRLSGWFPCVTAMTRACLNKLVFDPGEVAISICFGMMKRVVAKIRLGGKRVGRGTVMVGIIRCRIRIVIQPENLALDIPWRNIDERLRPHSLTTLVVSLPRRALGRGWWICRGLGK